MPEPLVLVHGGAGSVSPASLPGHRAGCEAAARAGGEVLLAGGTAVEAACAAVELLEDNPLYNAGTGCALDRTGRVSLDAAVMDGETMEAGAVACLPAFHNPVRIAQRLVRVKGLVLLAGDPAAQWAEREGFQRVPEEDLIVEHSREALRKMLEEGVAGSWAGGTVGAVARDRQGALAAATSTGGTMGKHPGRIGDSPVIGAGTYADGCSALSATGVGEAFMRAVFCARVAEDVVRGETPEAALERLLKRVEEAFDGHGGAIMITKTDGPFAHRNTRTMSHAWWTPSGGGVGD